MTVEAIVFDFDGVIIDTESPDLDVWQEFFRAHGLEVSIDLWMKRTGYNEADSFDPARHYEQLTGIPVNAELQQKIFEAYVERCYRQPVLPGVEHLLRQASKCGVKLAIASSGKARWVKSHLQQHNLLSYFDCICTREDVKEGKPAPDLYLAAVECLGVPADHCLAIEDSPNGMRAALAAGIRCIAVPNPVTNRLERPEVSLSVPSLEHLELSALLAQF